MPERPIIQGYPLELHIIETTSSIKNVVNTVIGNSGGYYAHIRDTDHFTQHFLPDESLDPALNRIQQVKYSTLYPAVLFEFLQWQESLPKTDPRKSIVLIYGSTNKTMSDFRQKLLGDSYSFYIKKNEQNLNNPIYVYTIDISKIREDHTLLEKLQKFSNRTKLANYKMSVKPPIAGEIKSLTLSAKDF